MRQKLTTTGCLIQVTRLEADYVIEGRVGALGTDSMEVTYGIPSSNGLGTAASALGWCPAVPVIPEISVGKRNGVKGISKIVVFAYHRETSIPVWQSGSARRTQRCPGFLVPRHRTAHTRQCLQRYDAGRKSDQFAV